MKKYILLGVLVLLIVLLAILVILCLRLRKRKTHIDISKKNVYNVEISGGADPITGVYEKGGAGLMNSSNRGTLIMENRGAVNIRLVDIEHNIDYGYMSLAKEVTIGSQYGNAKLKIWNDATISKAHCILYSYNMTAYIKDIGSSNGTFVNGKRIFTDTIILTNDELVIGNTHLLVEVN